MKGMISAGVALAAALLVMSGWPSDAMAGVMEIVEVQTSIQVDGRKVVVVRRRPPALRIEMRSPRPSRRHVWIDGHWRHQRGRFVWVKGHWTVRPHVRAVYVRPKWTRHGEGWVFVRGHWR